MTQHTDITYNNIEEHKYIENCGNKPADELITLVNNDENEKCACTVATDKQQHL